MNHYIRKYYQSFDGKYRITVDSMMDYFRLSQLSNTFSHKQTNKNVKIVELKYDKDYDEQAKNVTCHFPFRVSKISKYVEGVQKLGICWFWFNICFSQSIDLLYLEYVAGLFYIQVCRTHFGFANNYSFMDIETSFLGQSGKITSCKNWSFSIGNRSLSMKAPAGYSPRWPFLLLFLWLAKCC